ncbi:MAG: neutral zinc metallopeptidase [Bradyrhizobium sp.]|nr:neutral zinc metallopeptidase [Bradyrhizobium sp.]
MESDINTRLRDLGKDHDRIDKVEANSLRVRIEPQADCLAGVRANRTEEKWKIY